jgi:FtsP/CotA-like multicopper oxidase with cupredoxin domain
LLSLAAPGRGQGAVREYWIAAVPVVWHVVPSERDAIMGQTFDPAKTTMQTVVYRRFTKDWAKMIPNGPDDRGIQGPLIRAEVGDTILVHFENLDTVSNEPHSMHFHGVHYRFGSDGSYIPGFSGPGADVKPGRSFTYRLVAGPDSVGVWPYHDHSPSMDQSIAGGLYGALSIAAPGAPKPDHEFVVFLESQLGFNTIDGRAFVGNTPVFHAKVGDLVQWDVLALGDDHHTFHVHAHRWRNADGTFEDVRDVGPAQSFAVQWREDDPGTWLYHCHVEAHMMNGMIGIYRVSQR